MLLNSRTVLLFIFIICFPEKFFSKFLVISGALILLGLRPGEVKIYPKAVIFVSDSHKTDYLIPSPNIFLILLQFFQYDQPFLMTLIFLCITAPLARMTPQSMFYSGMFRAYLCMIFVCANCASFSPQPTIFNSACVTYFLYVWDVSTPQPTFYSDIFKVYFCMVFVCLNCATYHHYTSLQFEFHW